MAHLPSNNVVEDSSMEARPAQKKLKSTQTTELLSSIQKLQIDIREKDKAIKEKYARIYVFPQRRCTRRCIIKLLYEDTTTIILV